MQLSAIGRPSVNSDLVEDMPRNSESDDGGVADGQARIPTPENIDFSRRAGAGRRAARNSSPEEPDHVSSADRILPHHALTDQEHPARDHALLSSTATGTGTGITTGGNRDSSSSYTRTPSETSKEDDLRVEASRGEDCAPTIMSSSIPPPTPRHEILATGTRGDSSGNWGSSEFGLAEATSVRDGGGSGGGVSANGRAYSFGQLKTTTRAPAPSLVGPNICPPAAAVNSSAGVGGGGAGPGGGSYGSGAGVSGGGGGVGGASSASPDTRSSFAPRPMPLPQAPHFGGGGGGGGGWGGLRDLDGCVVWYKDDSAAEADIESMASVASVDSREVRVDMLRLLVVLVLSMLLLLLLLLILLILLLLLMFSE